MPGNITRRDLLNGIAITSGALMSSPAILAQELGSLAAGADDARAHYPPVLTGMRGSHDGSYEVAHALAWNGEKPATYESLDEHYDLVVVGAGHSGLAAAWYWRKAVGPGAKILLLDNHDDFGGHAKRNEFHHNGRMVLCLGGAQNMENPGGYSDNARELLGDLGVDDDFLDDMADRTPDDYFLGGNFGAATGLAVTGDDGLRTVTGPWASWLMGGDGYVEAIRKLALPADEQEKLIAFIGGDRDYLDDLSLREKYEYCKTTSYHRYLTDRVGLAPGSIDILDNRQHVFMGVTGGSLSVLESIANGSPGLNSMGWLAGIANSLMAGLAEHVIEARLFPDGNASLARLLTQKLIPQVAPQMRGPEDVAVTRFDYAALDLPDHDTRLRLESTVVGVRERSDSVVEVDYVREGRAQRITANHCILACYNGLIPHICPQLPDAQKEALAYGVKVPFIYASVLLDNGRAFSELDTSFVQCTGQPFQWVSAAPTSTIGGYEPPRSLEDPMALFLMSAPTTAPQGDETARDLLRFARHRVYATTFEQYEQQIRDQLQALLGSHGFDHSEDIQAITVNRISHGYAYEYLALYDPEFTEGERPCEIGRAQFGRISIANSDSEARAYMDAAWNAAWRAVAEQTTMA